jgi:hypothetical protein
MAGKRKANKTSFKKGQSGNPNGSSARAMDPVRKKMTCLTASEVAELGSLLLRGCRSTLQEIGNNPDATLLELGFAACMADAIQNKDFRGLDRMLDRVIGKSKETVELSGRDGKPMSMEVAQREMTEAEMLERADALAKQRMEAGDD